MSSPANGWISFWEHNLLGDHQHPDFPPWSDPSADNETLKGDSLHLQHGSLTYSTETENSKGDSFNQDNRKRARDDSSNGTQGKACREKLRRDRMNDRFVELGAVLEPDKPPKTDKASILRDAARIISQLRAEALHYKEANYQLQDTIKELKAEKNELREEKLSLKAEKDALEKRWKSVHIHPGYAVQAPPAVQAAGTSSLFTPPNHTLFTKSAGTSSPNHTVFTKSVGSSSYTLQNGGTLYKPTSYSNMAYTTTMSQWIPPEVADVSNDHVLRPPVA